jgi:small-conductance mechanosensitive channel
VPIPYTADRQRAEAVLLQCAREHSVNISRVSDGQQQTMRRRYGIEPADFEPRVYVRILDSWLELTARFVTPDRGIRDIKDAMSRDILDGLDAAGIGIATTTYEIVGLPRVRLDSGDRADASP